jgi:type I restriction enzyme S subunit
MSGTVKLLGEICEISTGSTDTKDATENGQYPLFDRSKRVKASDKYLFDCEALIMPGEGAEFLPRHYIGKFDLHQRAYAMFNFSDLVDPQYLYFYLISVKDYFANNAVGATVKSLRRRHFTDLEVPLPSLEKQRDIVAKLDSAFAEIEDAKMRTRVSLQNLSKLLDSKFEEVFAMTEAEFGVVQSGTIIDVRDGTHDSPSYVDSGYPLITSKNLQDGLIDFSKVSLITEEDYQQINKRSKVEAGDLLFAMIGTIGNPVVVKEDPLFAIKNVALFKGNPSYDMTFLSFYLRTPKIREKFEREAKGTTQRFLGLGYLRTLDIPNVPAQDQLEIVRKLEQFESEIKKLELNLKQRLENFIELNNSIVSSMFTLASEEEAVA